MTKRTRRLMLFTLPVALAGLGIALWLLLSDTQINETNAAIIQPGMSLEQVEAILGGPARDESSGLRSKVGDPPEAAGSSLYVFQLGVGAARADHPCKLWQSDRVMIRVDFDANMRVTATDTLHVRRVWQGPLEMTRRSLGL